MRLNVMKWLASVQEFAAIGAEPVAVAEELYRPLEMLPREFRAMILGNNLDAIMGSLVRWMPRPFYDKLTATMANDPAQKAWTAEFIRALQEQADEPEPPQPVGPGAAHDDRAADIAQGAGPSIFEPVESPFGPPTPSPFGPSPFDAPATPQPTKPGDAPPPTL